MRANPVRTCLSTLGIVMGAASLIGVLSLADESLLISLAGTTAGALVGLAAATATTAVMRAQTGAIVYAVLTWQTLAVGMGTAALVGVVFGAYPGLKAARLSPIDAMRNE